MNIEEKIRGCLLGAAIGDALGLPYEGLAAKRAKRLLGSPERFRLFFGRGMVSDDTEHLCMVSQALIESGGDVEVFRKSLAKRLKLWLLLLPAGIGLATLKATIRLWLGVSPEKSGVYSAGNGAAMRASVLGVVIGNRIEDREKLRAFVRASSRLTHTDPKAEFGAYAVALASCFACTSSSITPVISRDYLNQLEADLGEEARELIELLKKAALSAEQKQTTQEFAAQMGLQKGVSGYVYHTVPVVIQAWLLYGNDYRSAVQAVILCGGDTDTTGAIVGGIAGAAVGEKGIPEEWCNTLAEWQRTPQWIETLGTQLAETQEIGRIGKPIRLSVFVTLLRNLWFLAVILSHGFRRLLPPY